MAFIQFDLVSFSSKQVAASHLHMELFDDDNDDDDDTFRGSLIQVPTIFVIE